MDWIPQDEMGRWLLFIAVAGTWIGLQALFLAWAKSVVGRKD